MRITTNSRRQGIALIVVMLVIVVLALLAAGFSYAMKVETQLARNADAESELLWLGRSGVELACWYLAEKSRDPTQAGFDALSQLWAGGPIGTNQPLSGVSLERTDLGRGTLSVRIIDLERRFNINLARPEIVQKAMDVLGYDLLSAATVVDSMDDWRDPDDLTRAYGAESEDYLKLGYMAKNGPIDDLSELILIQGVTPELLWGSEGTTPLPSAALHGHLSGLGFVQRDRAQSGLGFVALFNTLGAMQVNINTASSEVLQLLPGMDHDLAQEIIRFRSGPDQVDGTEDDLPFLNVGELINVGSMPPQYVGALQRICSVRSQTFEVRVRVRLNEYQRTYVAIVKRSASDAASSMPVLQAYWDWD